MRLLTFLATDLVGSTDLLRDLGETRPESLLELYFAMVGASIVASGGTEDSRSGDCLTAAFEAPSQALACAVTTQQAFGRHNADSNAPGRLDVRIGIAVGEVLDETGNEEHEGPLTGPSLRARQLCDTALGGQIIVSNLVAVLTHPRNGHPLQPLGLLQLPSFAEPMPAFEVQYEPSR